MTHIDSTKTLHAEGELTAYYRGKGIDWEPEKCVSYFKNIVTGEYYEYRPALCAVDVGIE